MEGNDGGKRWREIEGNNVREMMEGNDGGKWREMM